MDKFDKRLNSIAKLIHQGMVMLGKTNERLAESAQSQKELRQDLKEISQSHKELAAAQKATDRSLKAFIDSMRSGRNGR